LLTWHQLYIAGKTLLPPTPISRVQVAFLSSLLAIAVSEPETYCFTNKNAYLCNVTWRIEIMKRVHLEKPENRHERSDRIAREYVSAERKHRDEKTARLRDMRLKMERMAA
jgi:hypothetical protein